MSNQRAKAEGAVLDYVRDRMPEEIRQLRADALFDLRYGGGGTSDAYPGFVTALEKLRAWIEKDMPSQLYFDSQSEEVFESVGDDDSQADLIEFDSTAVKKVVFGELVTEAWL